MLLFIQLISKDRNLSSVVLFLPNYYFTIVPCFSVDAALLVCMCLGTSVLCYLNLHKAGQVTQLLCIFEIVCLNSTDASMWESSCVHVFLR